MKSCLLAGIAIVALCAGAHAATLSYTTYDGTGSYYAPDTTSSSNFTSGMIGSTGASTSPFGANSTEPYDVVNASGFATFGGAATGSGSFGTGSGTFSFLWGSPDNFNTLSFLSGGDTVASFTGKAVAGGPQNGSYLVTIDGLSSYDSIKFTSGSDAFEFAAVSAVPLPAGLPMFGGAVLALGVVGLKLRRKGAAARS